MSGKTKVALLKQSNYETIKEGVKRLVDLIGGFKNFLKENDRIWIKPNVSRPAPGIPTCTDPRIVVAIIELLREEVGTKKIVVADNPVFAYPGKKAFVEIGMEQSVTQIGADVVKLDESDWVLTEIPGGKVLKEVLIPKLYYETDAIINVPKWKTHLQTDVTLCVKNFHGVIHWDYRRIHHTDQLPQKLVDILKVVKPTLNIVDGVVGGILSCILYPCWKDGIREGRSFGKGMSNIKVVKYDTGAPASIGDSIMRNCGESCVGCCTCGLTNLLTLYFILLTDDKRRVGDRIAGTIVVRD